MAPSERLVSSSSATVDAGIRFPTCAAMWAGTTAKTKIHQRRGGTSRNTANIVALGSQNSEVGSVGALRINPSCAPR